MILLGYSCSRWRTTSAGRPGSLYQCYENRDCHTDSERSFEAASSHSKGQGMGTVKILLIYMMSSWRSLEWWWYGYFTGKAEQHNVKIFPVSKREMKRSITLQRDVWKDIFNILLNESVCLDIAVTLWHCQFYLGEGGKNHFFLMTQVSHLFLETSFTGSLHVAVFLCLYSKVRKEAKFYFCHWEADDQFEYFTYLCHRMINCLCNINSKKK